MAIPDTIALTSCSQNSESEYGFGMVPGEAGGGLFPNLWLPVSPGKLYGVQGHPDAPWILPYQNRLILQVDER